MCLVGLRLSIGCSDTVSRLTLAQRDDGYMDVGIVGALASTGDSDTELYRLRFNVQSVSGRRTEAASFETTKILDYSLATRPDAYRALIDLQKLDEQMTKNLAALDKMTEYIAQNLDLSRAVGFAFLDMSNAVQSSDTDVEKIAEKLRNAIRRNAKGSLSQAENLQSIVIASLTYGSS